MILEVCFGPPARWLLNDRFQLTKSQSFPREKQLLSPLKNEVPSIFYFCSAYWRCVQVHLGTELTAESIYFLCLVGKPLDSLSTHTFPSALGGPQQTACRHYAVLPYLWYKWSIPIALSSSTILCIINKQLGRVLTTNPTGWQSFEHLVNREPVYLVTCNATVKLIQSKESAWLVVMYCPTLSPRMKSCRSYIFDKEVKSNFYRLWYVQYFLKLNIEERIFSLSR